MADLIGRKDEVLSFEEQLARYRTALSRLVQFGISVPDSSRLRGYEKRLRWITEEAGPYVTQFDADHIAFDLREIDEVSAILESMDEVPSQAALRLLRLLPKGKELPDEEKDSRVRDAQYELYLYSVLSSGGVNVALEEPDLVVTTDVGRVQIAAKRPISSRRFDDRLRSAIRQVEIKRDPAVIALSLDHLIRPVNSLLAVPSPSVINHVIESLVSSFVRSQSAAIARRVGHRGVGALFFTARLPGRTVPDNVSFTATHLHVERVNALGPASDDAFARSQA